MTVLVTILKMEVRLQIFRKEIRNLKN